MLDRALLPRRDICMITPPSPARATIRRMNNEVMGLFPIPVMRASAVVGRPLVNALVDHFAIRATRDNNTSPRLAHTEMLSPQQSPLFVQVAAALTPCLAEFGTHLFGERIGWSLKEMWVNVLETGGHQAMHNHANSFISGVLYLTPTHPSAQTVFMKSPGGYDFSFKNEHEHTTGSPFNSDKWISPAPQPGDVMFFPSYLMHAVPPNQGERRITLAFNAIPSRLDSWGYVVRFSG